MMDWASVTNDVSAAIAEVGRPAKLLRRRVDAGPVYAPTTSETEHDCMAVTMQYGSQERQFVQEGSTKVLLAASGLGIQPTTSDRLLIDGEHYSIVNVMPLKPGGVVLYWQIEAQSG